MFGPAGAPGCTSASSWAGSGGGVGAGQTPIVLLASSLMSAPSGAGDDAAEGAQVDILIFRSDPLPRPRRAPVGVAEECLLVMVPAT